MKDLSLILSVFVAVLVCLFVHSKRDFFGIIFSNTSGVEATRRLLSIIFYGQTRGQKINNTTYTEEAQFQSKANSTIAPRDTSSQITVTPPDAADRAGSTVQPVVVTEASMLICLGSTPTILTA